MLYITIAFNCKQPKEKTNVEARYYKFECRKDIQYINNTYIVYHSLSSYMNSALRASLAMSSGIYDSSSWYNCLIT